ncbi:hypothetical protein EDB81DRAFT_847698 [Dactylonectria macrodidyma]|uniref:Uncharacterized protein n=1 Tax=Dactylonectria macrodidyma TaxID=307937 RepID=A0A9P9IJD7_9HYPO|nr:hypothetical protein EDB81DRAFT_847698 [Dactylonectria macrodidyma]
MTSMIASIAVERHGVPTSIAAEVSIARFTNAGPRSFSKLLLSGATFNSWIRILTATFFFLVVASEFTSTLLVTDLRESRVSSFDQNMSYGFTFKSSNDSGPPPLPIIGWGFNYWLNKPSSSETFAEYSRPGKSGEDVDDTGPSIRAFLPLALQSERETLRSFKGMARVVDTRVQYFGWFSCPILDNSQNFPGQQPWVLCTVTSGMNLVSPLTNATSLENSTARSFSAWMIIDTASIHEGGYGSWNSTLTWEHLNSSGSGPWLRQWSRAKSDDGEADKDYYFPITLCFDYAGAAQIQNLNITATTTSNSTEPIFRYDADSKQYDTSAVRNQLGAFRHNPHNDTRREILTISEQDMQESMKEVRGKPLASPYTDTLGDWLEKFLTLPNGKALALCPLCSPDLIPFQIVDSLLTQVFNDVLNATNSPALALQAFRTLLYRTTYYDHLSAFDLAADAATITRFDLVQAPEQRWGLMASEEARPLLEKATLAADEDIDDWVHEREPPKGFWGIIGNKVWGIGRLFSQKSTPDSERLSVRNGVFTVVGTR